MAYVKLVSTTHFQKGCKLQNFIDESKPENSIERKYSLLTLDGEPESETFDIPLHWHKHQDEHMTVLSGRAIFTVGDKVITLTENDPSVLTPRRVMHGMKSIPGQKLVLKEMTDPTGDYKEEFFLDLLGPGGDKGLFHTMRVFWDADVYPALGLPWFRGGKFADELFIFVLGGIAKMIMPSRPSLQELRKRVS